VKNDKIKEKEFKYVDKSNLEINGTASNDMKGNYKCAIDFFYGLKNSTKSLDVIKLDVNAAKVKNISISIIAISFISLLTQIFK
jgi:hypothetical protein